MILGFILIGCTDYNLETQSITEICDDSIDQNESILRWSFDDSDILVQRTSVFKSSDAIFTPEVSIEEDQIYIREFWDTAEAEEEGCFVPTLKILNPQFDNVEVWWFLADEQISIDIVEIEID